VLALRRIVYRALAVGVGEYVVALVFTGIEAPTVRLVVYPLIALFLASPAALVTIVEILAARWPRSPARAVCAVATSLVVSFVGVLLAHLQAIYASGVISSGRLPGGLESLREHWEEVSRTSAQPVVAALVAFALPFALMTLLTVTRLERRARITAIVVLTMLLVFTQGEALGGRLGVAHATCVVALTLPPFFTLGDRLALRNPQRDEQGAT
jgi:hypothetical protein